MTNRNYVLESGNVGLTGVPLTRACNCGPIGIVWNCWRGNSVCGSKRGSLHIEHSDSWANGPVNPRQELMHMSCTRGTIPVNSAIFVLILAYVSMLSSG